MRRVPAVFLTAIMLTACGTATRTAPPASPAPTAGFPVTVGNVTISKRPAKIVSLSPTATEMLFAIDAGSQVVAVDDQSDYPAKAPKTKLSGFQPNTEAIAGYSPDLVVTSNSAVVAPLTKLNIPVLLQDAAKTLDDTYAQIAQLGVATGHPREAASVVSRMRSEIQGIVSKPTQGSSATYYHELDDQYFSVTSKTFVGEVYSLFGLKNIADAAPKSESGYPQLSAEYIVNANPQLIFLADTRCCGLTAQKVGQRPGWSSLSAVTSGRVIELDDSVASRWGPRVVDFVRAVAGAVAKLVPART